MDITLTKNQGLCLSCGLATLGSAATGAGLVKWGGRFIASLALAGTVRAGLGALFQTIPGILLGAEHVNQLPSIIKGRHLRSFVASFLGEVAVGTLLYTICALAAKAGLIATAPTLAAAAALIVGSAIVGTTIGFGTDAALDYLHDTRWITITK